MPKHPDMAANVGLIGTLCKEQIALWLLQTIIRQATTISTSELPLNNIVCGLKKKSPEW